MVGTRGSTPREKAKTPPDGERGTNHFKSLWPEFKKLGWTSKAPPGRGVETRWKYIMPGGNPNGTVGVDYVLGEQAVVEHATEIGRQQAVERVRAAAAAEAAKMSRSKSPVRQPSPKPSAKTAAVAPSTRAGMSPSTSPKPIPPTRSPAPAPPALALPEDESSISTTKSAETPTTPKKKGRMTIVDDDEWEGESSASRSDEEPKDAGPNTFEVIDLSGSGADDPNSDGTCIDDYQLLDSGDESEETDLNDLDGIDSDASVAETIDEDDEEMFANEERHFADYFLESIGGEEKILAGEVIGPALKDIATTGWDEKECPDVEAFLQTPYTPVADDDEYPALLPAWTNKSGVEGWRISNFAVFSLHARWDVATYCRMQ